MMMQCTLRGGPALPPKPPVCAPAVELAVGVPHSVRRRRSVHLDGGEDLPYEPVAGVETDGAGQQEEDDGGDEHVPEIEERRDELGDLELGEEVEDGVGEHVPGRRARRQEGAPPPVVVLRAQLEVAHDHRDLGARDDEDDEDEQQEAEDVVELVQPDGREDEEELYEDGAEGQHASHRHREGGLHVPHLLGHLARDLIDAHGHLERLASVAEVGAEEDERHRDAEPEDEQRAQRAEGDGARRLLSPDDEVEHEEDDEDHAREEARGQDDVLLPLDALEVLVEEGGRVAGRNPHEDEEQQHRRHQPSTVGGRKETEHREDHGDDAHREGLHARPHQHREHHRHLGRPEDVAMHQLPARLLLHLLRSVDRVVPVKISMQRPHHDHRHHARQEEDDHERIDDREPVDLIVAHVQVEVPSRRPFDVGQLPLDVVRIDHLRRRVPLGLDRLRRQVGANGHGRQAERAHVR
mmetsp:Transcript_27966/g.65311  ORF Transcript_27966/g.65311 Transcript_27966/m.65311 type:complete len:466 (-) Transcript_27966:756-2153(-)